MARYIIMPRMRAAQNLTTGEMASSSRSKQIKTSLEAHGATRGTAGVRTVLADHGIHRKPTLLGSTRKAVERSLGRGVAAAAAKALGDKDATRIPLLGAMCAELPSDRVAEIAADLPSHHVLLDEPLSLIRPKVLSVGKDPESSSEWRWFQEHVGANIAHAHGISGRDVGVAVLDTGVQGDHPAFEGRVRSGTTFNTKKGSWKTSSTSVDTDNHGTHVAGIIAASDVGIAPGASIYSGTMIPNGDGWFSDFILALEWAAGNKDVHLINISAGIRGFHPQMLEVIRPLEQFGLIAIVAIGNEGRSRSRSPGNYSESLSVGSSNESRRVSSFSGGGTIVHEALSYRVPDLVAPGEKILSTIPLGDYAEMSGTSMAAPVVTGLVALLLEKHPAINTYDVADALLESCEDLGFDSRRQGAGLVSFPAADKYLA